jgi:hypothetical protein
MRKMREVKGSRFTAATTPRDVANAIGAAPGQLGNLPLSADANSALKYFGRRWLGLSRADVIGPLANLRSVYDGYQGIALNLDSPNGKWDGAPSAPAAWPTSPTGPNPFPKATQATPSIPEIACRHCGASQEEVRQDGVTTADCPQCGAPPAKRDKPPILVEDRGTCPQCGAYEDECTCPAQLPSTKPPVPATAPAAPRAPYQGNGDADQLRTALQALIGPPALDSATVRALIQEELAKAPSAHVTITVKTPNRPEITGEPAIRHAVFPEVCATVAAGLNVLLVGPAGSGKTHIAEQVATSLNIPFAFTGAVASEFKLSGFKNAAGIYQETAYRTSYEFGGVFLADEIDGSSANALLYMNAGLANGQQDFPDAIVKRHDDFRMLASANTFGHGADRQYVGRNQLDAASLDRFYVVPMDYDEILERSIYGDTEWTRFVQRVRAAIKSYNGAIRHVVSMRAIDSGSRALAAGIDRQSVERAVIWKHLGAAEIQKIRAVM